MHTIHARKVGETPWGWRDGTIVSMTGLWLDVDYLDGRTAQVWHHVGLADEIAIGTLVRLHEGYYALECPAGWLNVLVGQGAGPVPRPEHPDLWRADVVPTVTDLRSGRGIPIYPETREERPE